MVMSQDGTSLIGMIFLFESVNQSEATFLMWRPIRATHMAASWVLLPLSSLMSEILKNTAWHCKPGNVMIALDYIVLMLLQSTAEADGNVVSLYLRWTNYNFDLKLWIGFGSPLGSVRDWERTIHVWNSKINDSSFMFAPMWTTFNIKYECVPW